MNGVDAIVLQQVSVKIINMCAMIYVLTWDIWALNWIRKRMQKRGEDIIISTPDSKVAVMVIPTNEELRSAVKQLRL